MATLARSPQPHDGIATQPIASRWPTHAPDEIAIVADVLRSGRVNGLHHGEWCKAFEAGFADLCAMPHAIALANGTLALEVALRALGIGSGAEVIVPARSFMATASCVIACGAKPVFADIDPDSQSLTAGTIAQVVTPRTRGIIVVHLGGYPAPMEEIAALATSRGIALIEDCAQAHGATIAGRRVGSFGDAGAFSFCTDKIMSTGGEGGMLVLRSSAVWARAWAFKDHGKDHGLLYQASVGTGFRWLHRSFGSNYRLTELQAAIGMLQLGKLDGWIAQRRHNAATLLDQLDGLAALRLIRPGPDIGHAYYKFYAFVRPDRLRPGWTRDRIVAEAQAQGLPCQTGSCPEIYLEQACIDAGLGPSDRLPVARALGETSIMLPVDPTLDEATCRTMGTVLRAIIERGSSDARD
jgi:dTDP-4-amino-4,6-dideoxygalactose transaminase